MNSTFQDRLVVIVAPLMCTVFALGWTLIRGDQVPPEDIGVVADQAVAEPSGAGAVHAALIARERAPAAANAETNEPVDALDSTVGDYSHPDPLPAEMLRGSYEAASLGLVDPPEPLPSAVRLSQTAVTIAGDSH